MRKIELAPLVLLEPKKQRAGSNRAEITKRHYLAMRPCELLQNQIEIPKSPNHPQIITKIDLTSHNEHTQQQNHPQIHKNIYKKSTIETGERRRGDDKGLATGLLHAPPSTSSPVGRGGRCCRLPPVVRHLLSCATACRLPSCQIRQRGGRRRRRCHRRGAPPPLLLDMAEGRVLAPPPPSPEAAAASHPAASPLARFGGGEVAAAAARDKEK